MSPRTKHEAPEEQLQLLSKIDIRSSIAVYEQIENCVRFGIASGKLKAGERIPSVRELSERLEVNPNTIVKAYHDLEIMGILYTRRGMGVFIQSGFTDRCRKDTSAQIIGRMHEIISEAKAAGIKHADIQSIVKACLKSDSQPYSPVPKEVLALSKTMGK